MYITREIQGRVRDLVRSFPIITLIGPRQSGKTTMIRHLFKNYRYISLEDLDNRSFAETDPRGFLDTYNKRVIIDEAQKVPQLFSYLQTHIDRINRPGQYILTGSQNFLLHQHVVQTLAGRVAMVTLLPLSISELKKGGILFDTSDEYIYQGGYPRIYNAHIDPSDWYPSYIETYIERDVRNMKQITNLSAFRSFVKLCAGRIGQLLNLSDLARDVGISHNTVKSWLSVLEASFIIFFLTPYFKNFNKRIIKAPKLYFYDTGLACTLLNINNNDQIESHYLKGSLFENLIVSEYMKAKLHRRLSVDYYFWRDKLGHEIDLLQVEGEKIAPIEIKAGKTITSDYFSNILYFQKITNRKEGGCVIYGGDENQQRSEGKIMSWRQIT